MVQLNNPFQMNDWGIGKFFKVVLAIQLALWGVIGLDTVGLQIPILRQLIGFIYLAFIPGIIILRILKLHNLGNIETLLYTVGLSVAALMFTGLIMNTVYPLFGISRPISTTPLIITISVVVLVLSVLSYVRDKDFSEPSSIDLDDALSPPALFLCLIPFLAVFGTYMVNFCDSNILLMFLFVILALIVLLIAFDKLIPNKLYPFAVFVIALSLLYHRSLISMYIIGWDIHVEYYLANLVKMNGIWDSTIPSTINAMLSIVMLAPIFSDIGYMSSTWFFKTIYPLLFSLVPLGLYQVFQKQTNCKVAFLSIFFFMSMLRFYSPMPRQNIAEFYLVLLILSMVDKTMDEMKKSILFVVFGLSFAVSHYGLSYIYMFCLISAWLILVLAESPRVHRFKDNLYSKFNRYKTEGSTNNPISPKIENRAIGSTFVLLFIIFTLTWYMYISSSSAFNAIVHIGDHIARSVFTEFLNPEFAEGWRIIMEKTVSPLHDVTKYLHLLSQFFILVGILALVLKRDDMKFEREYVAFSLVNFAICFAAIGVPYFASALNTDRLYHVTLIFLAPFCVIGGIMVFKVLSRIVNISWTDQQVRNSFKILSVFLGIFLLFNSGFVYEIMKDHPESISLSQKSIKEHGNVKEKTNFYNIYILEQDVFSAKWLSHNRDSDYQIYSDVSLTVQKNSVLASAGGIDYTEIYSLTNTTSKIRINSYIYLRYLNIIENIMSYRIPKGATAEAKTYNTSEIYHLIENKSKIYSNGGNVIYL